MKRIVIQILLAMTVLCSGLLFGGCDTGGCTFCGLQPGEHILIYYTDSDGAQIPVSGYADSNGCFRPDGCE